MNRITRNPDNIGLIVLLIATLGLMVLTIQGTNDIAKNITKTNRGFEQRFEKINQTVGELIEEIADMRANYNMRVENMTAENQKLAAELREEQAKKAELRARLESSSSYHTPTIKELRSFLEQDKTDKNLYVERKFDKEDEYVCTEFSANLLHNLGEKGIRSCITYVEFEEGAHHLVAVNTTTGLVYVEPQDDVIIEKELEIGKDYCWYVDWSCSRTIEKVTHCFQY